MQRSRPVNLNLFTIRFPLPAIVSILHRISGVLLFLLIPIMLWALQSSLSEIGFQTLQNWFINPFIKILIWLFLIPFCFHLVAGIRHLLMDIHIGTSLNNGRLTSVLTFIISFVLVVLVGIWLW